MHEGRVENGAGDATKNGNSRGDWKDRVQERAGDTTKTLTLS